VLGRALVRFQASVRDLLTASNVRRLSFAAALSNLAALVNIVRPLLTNTSYNAGLAEDFLQYASSPEYATALLILPEPVAQIDINFSLTLAHSPSCSRKPRCLASIASNLLFRCHRRHQHDAAKKVHTALRDLVPWPSHWQMPVQFVKGLLSRPVWTVSDLHSGTNLRLLASTLENNFEIVAEDLNVIKEQQATWPSSYFHPHLISEPGNWTKVMLYDGDAAPDAGLKHNGVPYEYRSRA